MKTIDIKKFILTGDFGGIKLGMNKDQAEKVLGKPELFGPSKEKLTIENAVIWRYGTIEFYFTKNKILEMIFCDYLDNIHGGKSFSIEPWIFQKKKEMAKQELIQKLTEEKITFHHELKIYGGEKPLYQDVFTFPGGVHLVSEDYYKKNESPKALINALYLKT